MCLGIQFFRIASWAPANVIKNKVTINLHDSILKSVIMVFPEEPNFFWGCTEREKFEIHCYEASSIL